MAHSYCPDCDERISFNPHARMGQKLSCPHCGVDLEVISVDPVELDWAYDWSWDDDNDGDNNDDDSDW